jgi:N4-gp56 family major capsid protein
MGSISSLTSDVTAPVNFVLMRGLLSQARKVLPYFNGTMPGQLEKNGGSMSVKWRRFDDLATSTTALGELTGTAAFQMGRTAATPSITDITVAVAKYGNFINYSEELDLFNVNSRAAQLMDVLGRNAGESLNVLARNVFAGATNIRYASGAASATVLTTAIDVTDVRNAVNTLNRNSAMKFFSMGAGDTNIGTSPVRSSYYGIVHPDVEEDIRDITGFIGVEQYGGYIDDVQVGEFGAVNGVRWSSTEISQISTSLGTTTAAGMRGSTDILNDVYYTYIYGKEAVGTVGLGEDHTEEIYLMGDRPPAIEVINHPVGSSGVGDPYNEVGSVAWKSWFAGQILNQSWVVEVQSLASDLSS